MGRPSFILPALLIAAAHLGQAQSAGPRTRDSNGHLWLVYSGEHPIRGSRWDLMGDAQLRRARFGLSGQQLLLRPGALFRLSPNVTLGGGYAFVRTYRYGDFPADRSFNEHRVFQQVGLRHAAGPVAIDHRYRLEQRWIQAFANGTASWRYQNRFRYQFRANIPVAKSGRWYVSAGDEIFLHFGANHGASVFDQNRAFAALGRKLTERNRIEVGYLNQVLIQRNGRIEENNHTIRIQFLSSAPIFRKR